MSLCKLKDVRLQRTIADVLGVANEDLSDASSPDTIENWDSLNHFNIILAIESEFGVELSPEDAFNMGSVALIRAVLRGHGVEV
jgi:acyl carrier protein